jgi:RND family efflux transporter MFP subunit
VSVLIAWAVAGAAAGAAEIPGITAPVKDATVSSKVAGRIERIPVKEGDTVKKGDILVELEHGLERLEAERRKLLWESRAELDAASNRVSKTRIDLDRTRRLRETTQSVSAEELEKLALDYTMSVAELDRLRTAELREEVEYRMAMEQIGQFLIAAPFDGAVTKLFLEEGENCEESQPLARVVNAAESRFTANVDAAAVKGLKVGDTVAIRLDGEKPAECSGRVVYISPVVDAASGLLEIKAEFATPAGMRPGLSATLVTHD